MDGPTFVVGTVRSRRGSDHLVVTRDGRELEVSFEGAKPMIGADVVGMTTVVEGRASIRLVDDMVSELLSGRALVSASGRPDVTARLLALMLSQGGPAAIRPGTGGIIERTPRMEDPDAGWALEVFREEAVRLGVALNVVSPLDTAGIEWSDANLVNDLLPADASGEREALGAMRTLFHSGMEPACRRTVQRLGRGTPTPSVDFIIPYSPFATGVTASNAMAGAFRDEVVKVPLGLSGARRLSSLREMSLAFSARYLGRRRGDPEGWRQLEATFADTAAAMLMWSRGDEADRQSVEVFRRLREAGTSRWRGVGTAPPASHKALAGAMAPGVSRPDARVEEILQDAADIARSFAPRNEQELHAVRAAASGDAFFGKADLTGRRIGAIRDHFERDLREAVGRLPTAAAVSRFHRYAAVQVPDFLVAAYDRTMADWEPCLDAADAFEDEGGIVFGDDPWDDAGTAHAPSP